MSAAIAEGQHTRELLIAAFLDINLGAWTEWVQRTGDDDIPTDLHSHVATVISSLADLADAEQGGASLPVDARQRYLQQIAMLSDPALRWLVEQAGTLPDGLVD